MIKNCIPREIPASRGKNTRVGEVASLPESIHALICLQSIPMSGITALSSLRPSLFGQNRLVKGGVSTGI